MEGPLVNSEHTPRVVLMVTAPQGLVIKVTVHKGGIEGLNKLVIVNDFSRDRNKYTCMCIFNDWFAH